MAGLASDAVSPKASTATCQWVVGVAPSLSEPSIASSRNFAMNPSLASTRLRTQAAFVVALIPSSASLTRALTATALTIHTFIRINQRMVFRTAS